MNRPLGGGCLTPAPAIINGEFPQINRRGVNMDVAQFLASIHCEMIASADDTASPQQLSQFSAQFCMRYKQAAGLHCKMQADDGNIQLMRSASILHGREMIKQAYDAHNDNSRFHEMIRLGTWSLEKAGAHMDNFLRATNLHDLKSVDGMIIRSLFTSDWHRHASPSSPASPPHFLSCKKKRDLDQSKEAAKGNREQKIA